MATVRELMEGILLQDVNEGLSTFVDPIDILSESNVILTDTRDILRKRDIDANAVTAVDKYGDSTGAAGVDTANDQDQTFASDQYTIGFSQIIKFEVPRDQFYRYGINEAMLNMDGEALDDDTFVNIINGLSTKIHSLTMKMNKHRKDQVRTLLANLGTAGASASQKPFGFLPVDVAGSRLTAWNYTNKLSAALDASEYDAAVDILAGYQKNAYNIEYGQSRPIILLHSSKFSLASKIHLPNISVNILNRNSGDAVAVAPSEVTGTKAVGVYNDTAHVNDWILLGANHKIYRRAMAQVNDLNNNGLTARIYVKENGTMVFELRNESEMVCDSAIDIIKSIV